MRARGADTRALCRRGGGGRLSFDEQLRGKSGDICKAMQVVIEVGYAVHWNVSGSPVGCINRRAIERRQSQLISICRE